MIRLGRVPADSVGDRDHPCADLTGCQTAIHRLERYPQICDEGFRDRF
jgi:hypothetical protein